MKFVPQDTAGAGGGRGSLFMTRTSNNGLSMTTPVQRTTEPYQSRSDVRAVVLPIVIRLTRRMMDPGAGVASKDAYVLNVRKDIGKGKANPLGQLVAIAYDDIQKGRPASAVCSYLEEFIEEIRAMEAERLGQRLTPPDLTPFLRIESREEGQENQATVEVMASPDCPDALQRFIDESKDEINATQQAVTQAQKRRVALLHRSPSPARSHA